MAARKSACLEQRRHAADDWPRVDGRRDLLLSELTSLRQMSFERERQAIEEKLADIAAKKARLAEIIAELSFTQGA